jgi:hypothetical protein
LGPFRSFEGVLFSVTLREAFWMMVDLIRLKSSSVPVLVMFKAAVGNDLLPRK